MYIQAIEPHDLAHVLEVYEQCEDFLALGPQPRASLDMVYADYALSRRNGGEFCGIYDTSEQLLGIIDYIPCGFEGQPDAAFIELLMIAAPFRNKGLGKAVVTTIEQIIRRNPQVTAIFAGVQVNNPAALHFWQSCGYAVISDPEPQPDGTIACLLRKDV
ncbi:MAG: GNAT family N-acetyltransferase [Anaerolineae bacterium]|nr:GNAT family N-acetyltransferase [Anaerolineae bacterium]